MITSYGLTQVWIQSVFLKVHILYITQKHHCLRQSKLFDNEYPWNPSCRARESEREKEREGGRERERERETRIKSGAFVDWISAWCMPLHALSMLYKCLNVYRQDVNAGQSGRPSYPGGLATATASLGNVGSTPHSSADLRVGTAVALASSVASSVAKYWVLTNLFPPGPLPQVSVYHHSHHNSSHRSGGGGEASSSKEPASSLNQEMALTSSSHHQQQSTAAHHHHQPSVSSSSSHHSSLQSNPQVC